MNIFVAKLDLRTESGDLQTAFEQFGEVSSSKVIMDKFTGKSKGFGFVEMPNSDEALKAIDALNNSEMAGSTILVKEAEDRSNDRRGGGGGYDRSRGGGGGYNRGGGGYDRGGGGYNRGGGGYDRNRGGGYDRGDRNDRGGRDDRDGEGGQKRGRQHSAYDDFY